MVAAVANLAVEEESLEMYLSLGHSTKRQEQESDHRRLRELMSSQWESILSFPHLSRQAISNWQFGRVNELVTHAFRTVPLYREKYSAAGFEPGSLRGWSDFESLPALTKDELIEAFPEGSISSDYCFEFTTRSSGSSGRFVTLAVSPDAIYMDTLQGARQLIMQSGGRYGPQDRALFVYTSPWWVSSIDGMFPTTFLPTTTPIERTYEVMKDLHPRALSLYPTYLTKMAGQIGSLAGTGLEVIIVHSEQSSSSDRKALAEHFGVAVRDEFSSEELTRIALECPRGAYHLEEDACFVEILDPKSGMKAASGTVGNLVGTNLLNMATPVIRYFQGDLAAFSGQENCECGSNFRAIEKPKGRIMDSIKTPDGDIVPASCFMDLAYNWYLEMRVPVHGLRYQILQPRPDAVEVHLVPSHFDLSDEQLMTVRESMYQLLPRTMRVDVYRSAEVPFNGGTKYRPVLSLLDGGR